MKRDKLFLIDGSSFCYRAFYAIRKLSTSKGQPTNAVYGFINMMRKIMEEQKPDYLAISFDHKGPTFRHEKYKEYKIHRKPMPDELSSQIPIIKEVLQAYKMPIYEKKGYEADDILATISKRAEKTFDVTIVTSDKDILQLVDEHIKVFNPYKGKGVVYDAKEVVNAFGIEPDKMQDYLALAGDSTDNIPGVPGMGEKSAVELLKDYGSIDGIYKNLNKIHQESKKKTLTENKEQVELSIELTKLDTKVPIDIDFTEMKIGQPDKDRLFEIFRELEFRALLKEVAPEKETREDYKIIESQKDIEELIAHIKKKKYFSFDLEKKDEEEIFDKSGVSLSATKGSCKYIDISAGKAAGLVKEIFEDEEIEKAGHDIKTDMLLLQDKGISIKGKLFDTMVASYLLDPARTSYELEDVCLENLGHKLSRQQWQGHCERADCIFQLKDMLEGQLKEKDLYDLFEKIEMPLVYVLAAMEKKGVSVDTKYLKQLSGEFEKRLHSLSRQIYEIAGEEFNINSPKQLGFIMFEKLHLPVSKRTKTGPSTDVEVLEKLASKHALPATILEFRELAKLKSTYVDALPKLIDKKTQRIHASFNQTGTQTGRLSSSQPNLQNIPIRKEEGKKIRRSFIPGQSGWFILSCDYSQVELRILAHLSGDENLMDAFKNDLDIHKHTASLIFNISEKDVTPQQRDTAKTVNFGIVYGMSPYGLSKDLGIEVEKAGVFIDSYFQRYPKVNQFIQHQIEQARKKGYVTTLFNRRRYIPEIDSENNSVRSFAERTAINAPIQGSAADLIKVAMIDIHKELIERKYKSAMIIQVHDELVFEAPEQEIDQLKELVKEKMEGAVKLKVPVKVKVSVGKNWLELK